jgi:hypothetical protein
VTVVTAPSSGSSPSAEAETASFAASAPYKELMDKVAALTAQVEKLTAPAPAPVAKAEGLPANIAALANAPKEENPIIKALMEGGPNAFKKALAAAGGEEGEVYAAINEAVVHNLVERGVVTAMRYKVLNLNE